MKKFLAASVLCLLAVPAFAAANVRIDDNAAFPESLGSANGALYIGSSTKGIIYRAKPGSQYAEPWIAAQPGFGRILGVVADAPSNTLWGCYSEKGKSALKSFDLKSGAPKGSYDFPGGGTCNDIALKNGAAYVTDTSKGRVLKLAKGAAALSEWYINADPDQRSLNGIVWTRDGKTLYVNTYRTHHIIRIAVNADGSAGAGTVLKPSIPLYQPDGMRLSTSGKILLTEGQGQPDNPNVKMGRVDEVTVDGDNATIKVIKDGFESPTAVTAIGNIIYVLECKSDYQSRPEMKNQDPGAFYAYAVPFK